MLALLYAGYPLLAKEKEENTIRIESYQADVTGDGLLETIDLKGIPFSKSAGYFHDIWAEVKSPDKEDHRWKINFGGGYEPSIQFVDLNHDNVLDLLFQSPTGGSGGLYHYDLYSLKDANLTDIPLPKHKYISGEFVDDFKAKLHFSPNKKAVNIELKNTQEYVQNGIYNKNGKLQKTTPLIIDPIAFFEPIEISERKGYGLKSFKQVSGAYHADQLGTIESLWYYEDGEWIILKTQWKDEPQKIQPSNEK
mgnify:FL=1